MTALPLLGLALLLVRRRLALTRESAESAARRHSVRREEDAMAQAAKDGDAPAFFHAARHAVQLQLGSRWAIRPEALTLGEIRRRDPAARRGTGAALRPGRRGDLLPAARRSRWTLARWQRDVHDLLHLQPRNRMKDFSRRLRFLGDALRLVVLLLALGPGVLRADADLDAANHAYTGGRYDEAAGLFQKLVDQHGYSAALCFNLANAQEKAGHVGAAMLNYERARYLAPGDREIDHNLQLARKQAGLEPNSYRWWQVALRSIDWTVWMAVISACLVLIFLAIVGISYLPGLASATGLPAGVLRTVFRAILFAGIPLTLLLGYIELATIGFNHRIEGVIVAPKSATLKISPLDIADSLGQIPEGELVTVEDKYKGYLRIEARDNPLRLGARAGHRAGDRREL